MLPSTSTSSPSLRKLKRFSDRGKESLRHRKLAVRGGRVESKKGSRIGHLKQKWTPEEEAALIAGVAKHGAGKWRNILKDSDFAPRLILRSNIDLKDKWRNLSVGVGLEQVSTTKNMKNPKGLSHFALPSCSLSKGTFRNVVVDSKTEERYNALIFEALLTMRNSDGCNVGAIGDFLLQQRVEEPIPQNFKTVVGARLRSLVSLGKLEKTHNGFKIKEQSFVGTNNRSKLPVYTKIDDAVVCETAYLIADAENKSFLASEAVKEAEKLSKIAEENEYMLLLTNEIYEQCTRGEEVPLEALGQPL